MMMIFLNQIYIIVLPLQKVCQTNYIWLNVLFCSQSIAEGGKYATTKKCVEQTIACLSFQK